MKPLLLTVLLLTLAGCAGYCPTDTHGLDPPPHGSSIPEPHG